ncbi:MAG: hypothetical protein R3A10_00600 [Caldilineaceae bacterium]
MVIECGRLVPSVVSSTLRDPKVATIGFVEYDGQLLLVQRAIDPAREQVGAASGFVGAGEMPADRAGARTPGEVSLDINIIVDLLEIYAMERPDSSIPASSWSTGPRWPTGNCSRSKRMTTWPRPAFGCAPDEIPPDLAFTSTQALIARWRQGDLTTCGSHPSNVFEHVSQLSCGIHSHREIP